MKRLNKILIPTDLSDHSRRAIAYGYRLAAEDKATLVVLHVANEFNTWELSTEFQLYTGNQGQIWPLDRVLSEASLDLNNFLGTPSRRSKTAAERDQAGDPRQRARAHYDNG